MTKDDARALDRWLAAERQGCEAEADEAFGALFCSRVEVAGPPAGFTERVMDAVPTGRQEVAAGGRWWMRAAAAALVAAAGTGLATVSPRLFLDAASLAWSVATPAAGALLDMVMSTIGLATTLAGLAVTISRAAAVVFTTGAAPVVIAANALLALASFVGLRQLLAAREEC